MSIGCFAFTVLPRSGAALQADNYTGVFGRVGTPEERQDANAVLIDDWLDSGLSFIAVYDNRSGSISAGRQDGAAHADAVIDDLNRMLLSSWTPVCAIVDRHTTAHHQKLALEYQQGFFDQITARAWRGPVGAYGFNSFLVATSDARCAEWFWLVGPHLGIEPWVDFWQDGSGRVWQYRRLRGQSSVARPRPRPTPR